MTLAETMNKYETVNMPDSPCDACQNAWFFDMGKRLSCTTCGKDIVVFEIDEDPQGYALTAGATVESRTRAGLTRGIETYKARYPVAGYATSCGAPWCVNGVWKCRMSRSASAD